MPAKVIVIGGGVAGMSAAHELARRGGFEVVVYEQRPVAGVGVDGTNHKPRATASS